MSRALALTAAVIVALAALELILPGVEHPPGALAAFGAVGCLALVLTAKVVAALLSRPAADGE